MPKSLNSSDKTFVNTAASVFCTALARAKEAGSDSFSFEFDAPAGIMTVVCLIRPKADADQMLEGLQQARQMLFDAGEKYDPISDPEFGKAESPLVVGHKD